MKPVPPAVGYGNYNISDDNDRRGLLLPYMVELSIPCSPDCGELPEVR